MHNALIVIEQAKVKEPGLGKRAYLTSLLNTTYWRIRSILLQKTKWDLYSSIIDKECKVYCPGNMNTYFIRDRQEQKRLSGILWHGLILHKMLNIDSLIFTCQVCQMTKKENNRKKYGMLPPEIAKSDTEFPGHVLCGSGRSIYNIYPQNTHSDFTHINISSSIPQDDLKFSKSQIC
jgi:hypothetical protein